MRLHEITIFETPPYVTVRLTSSIHRITITIQGGISMNNTSTMVQARTTTSLKNSASSILDELGLNMSTYINMALKQLVIQRGIPFESKLSSSYTIDETIDEINATMRMEGLNPTQEELDIIKQYKTGELSADDIRKQILSEV